MKNYQLVALGIQSQTEQNPLVYNPNMLKKNLIQKIDPQNLELSRHTSSYKTYKQKRQQRILIGYPQVNLIKLILIQKQNQNYSSLTQKISNLLSYYMCIQVKLYPYHLQIKRNKIIDHQLDTQKILRTTNNQIEVLDILYFLKEYQNDNDVVIGLVEAVICQGQNQIDGRAYGCKAAAISIIKQKESQCTYLDRIITTTLHQCLHLFGMGHCVLWKCLMNPVTNDEFFVCPCCLKKLQFERKFNIYDRYLIIKDYLKKIRKRKILNKIEGILSTF